MTSPETGFTERARRLYREASNHLDAQTRTDLRDARIRALAASNGRAPRAPARWLLPGGALAFVALAALMMWQPLPHGSTASGDMSIDRAINTDLDSDLPPDAEQVDPQLYENLDFYGWLAASDTPVNR